MLASAAKNRNGRETRITGACDDNTHSGVQGVNRKIFIAAPTVEAVECMRLTFYIESRVGGHFIWYSSTSHVLYFYNCL